MATYEYKTEILTSMVGRDKLRVDDLEDTLQKLAPTAGSSSRSRWTPTSAARATATY